MVKRGQVKARSQRNLLKHGGKNIRIVSRLLQTQSQDSELKESLMDAQRLCLVAIDETTGEKLFQTPWFYRCKTLDQN